MKVDLLTARSIAEAATKLQETLFDLILLDLGLPDSDGIQTVECIRKEVVGTPIVVLTANDTADMEILAIKLGIQDYVIKSKYDPFLLERVMRNAIYRQEIKTKLRLQNERLTQLMAVEEEYINMISHEIKNPLTIIEGTLFLLNENKFLSGVPDAEQMVCDITEQVSRLYKLVESILDLSRIEHGCMPIHKSSVELGNYIEKIIRFIQPQYPGKIQLTIQKNVPHNVILDQEKTIIVLHNLIHNATKFTHSKEGLIEIDIKVRTLKGQQQLLIAVKDNGPGISVENLKELFKRFNKFSKKAGTGLGLTIAKKLTWLMGGNIQVDSTVNVGTTFTVSLPLVRQKPVVEIISQNNNYIIDVKQFFEQEEIRVEVVSQAEKAIRETKEIQPDLILLDENQIGTSYLSIYEQLKKESGIDTIPVVLCKEPSDTSINLSGAFEIQFPIQKNHLKKLLNDYALIGSENER